MITAPFVLALLLAAADGSAVDKTPPPDPASAVLDERAELLKVRRVFVDRLTGGETAAHMRDMIISSLQNSRLFVITEDEERADAFLRGAAEDLIFTDKFSSSEGLNARASLSDRASSTRGRAGAAGVGENESVHIEERRHEATAAVRLVNRDGDVIWSTTKESLGGKFLGASADVADRITKQLVADYERARAMRGVAPAQRR
jgi:hypothetical protein